MNAFELLRLRQSLTRSQFAKANECYCEENQSSGEFGGLNGGGTSATVQSSGVETKVLPVRIIGNGWINPRQIVPTVRSGNISYILSMPQGSKGR
jgi:hypothetical protein